MATVTASSPRVIRSFSRTLPPVKETRTAPAPATPFGIGLEDAVLFDSWTSRGWHFDISQYEGSDCDFAFYLYASRDGVLVERRGFDTAGDAKAHAWCLSTPVPVEVEPEVKPEPAVRKPVTRPINRPSRPMRATRHTAADERWWASHSPTSRSFYFVEGSVDPYDTENLTLSAFDYHVNEMVLAPSLSDDYTDALATGCREGGDR